VEQRIRDAARDLFAERGYAGATTREIARLADVSETLLFRYYGDKATLFTDVVIAPFHRLMAYFVDKQSDPAAAQDPQAETRRFTRHVYELFENNEAMFRAILTGPMPGGGDDAAPGMRGLAPFFQQSVDQVTARYAAIGQEPPFDLDIGVRLGFGMIAASVILRDALFPEKPERDALVGALEHLISHTLVGPAAD
jgi:AcrR family transcriptional regulator